MGQELSTRPVCCSNASFSATRGASPAVDGGSHRWSRQSTQAVMPLVGRSRPHSPAQPPAHACPPRTWPPAPAVPSPAGPPCPAEAQPQGGEEQGPGGVAELRQALSGCQTSRFHKENQPLNPPPSCGSYRCMPLGAPYHKPELSSMMNYAETHRHGVALAGAAGSVRHEHAAAHTQGHQVVNLCVHPGEGEGEAACAWGSKTKNIPL